MSAGCLYQGDVVHVRRRPRHHRLRYAVFSILVDIDQLPRIEAKCRLFSVDRFNLFSFHRRDHADGQTLLRKWVDTHLSSAGIYLDGGAVHLLCYPRVLGFVFNPLSLYFCHRRDGNLAAILYEVHNTFGERHTYLIPVNASNPPGLIRQSCPKRLHVSPFIPMDARYDFRLAPPGETVTVTIAESDDQGPLLQASFVGTRAPFNDKELFYAFCRYPLMTLKVIAGIHWEALQIWRKGARYHRKPAPPDQPVTILKNSRGVR